jgi:crotonobetainyl-CoA:carnitine CoA-transferase CaiB-like acyl-CoA transferase
MGFDIGRGDLMSDRALAGLRVLDCSQGIAGAYCTKLLADFGAEVIKVEPPGVGDRSRALGPFPDDLPDPERSGRFLHLNTGKKSVTLDISVASGQVILKKLLPKSDVLVDSARPGLMAEYGLDHDSLKDQFPHLICASVTPFGHTGPWRDYTGDALTAWAAGGLMYVTGDPEREPLNHGVEVAEYFAAENLLIGILAALLWRAVDGGGQKVETSLMEAIAANDEYGALLYAFQGAIRRRWYSRHPFRYPSDLMACQDGQFALVYGRTGLQELAVMIGRPDLLDDPLFTTAAERFRRWREFEEVLRPYLMSHTARAIVESGQELHQPFALAPAIEDLLADPHLVARDAFATVEHPRAGTLRYPGAPWRMTETPWQTGPAPLLGEHNQEILTGAEIGYTPEETVVLRERGVI